jgi:hypothetical protein
MKTKFLYLFSFLICLVLLSAKSALAICPVCTVAVIGGVGLSRWLGVDDTITGLWVGGFIVSMIFWTIDWLNRKNIKFPFMKIIVWIGYYVLVIIPLYEMGIMGHPFNTLWGIDKLLLGTIFGSVGFLIGVVAYPKIKEKNGGKAHFPFEKIVVAIAPLIVLSLAFYIIIKF